MAPRNLFSWVKDLRPPLMSPHAADDDRSINSENLGREQHEYFTRAGAELESNATKTTKEDDPWVVGDDGESDDEISNPFEDLRFSAVPEPLKLQRSDTITTNDLRKVTELEWDPERQTWSNGSNVSSSDMRAREYIDDLQRRSYTRPRKSSRGQISREPHGLAGKTSSSGVASWPPSWLMTHGPAWAPKSAERLQDSAAVIRNNGDLYGSGPHQTRHGVGTSTASHVQRSSSVYQSDRNRETLKPEDSISNFIPPKPTIRPHQRTSIPPQIPPTIHTTPRCSTEPFPQYGYCDPSQDVQTRPIYSVPIDRLPKSHRPEQPLNGRTAWFHALAGFLVVFNCWGITNAWGLFQAYHEAVYLNGTKPSSIAWIGSTQLALVFGLGVPVGRFVDKGHFAAVFHLGVATMFAGLLGASWCTSLITLWAVQGLTTGIGMGMVFSSGLVAMMTWFDEKHLGMAMGLCAAGSCVGGIVYILIARELLISHGFATTMRALAAVMAATTLPANFIVRMRGQGRKDARLSPAATTDENTPRSTLRFFLNPAYFLLCLGMFFTFLGLYFGFVYIITYASSILRLSPHASSNLLIFMLLANLPGRFLPALISDKCIGPLNTLIPFVFASASILFLWAASASNTASLTVMACFYGFVSAGVQVLYAPTMYAFSVNERTNGKAVSIEKLGVKAGVISTCIGLACLVGTPIGGALISLRMGRGYERPYLGAQIFAGVCLLVGGVLLLGSRVAKAGWVAKRV